jgi:uncharacterized membrane protein (UPF0127 family)
MKIHINKKSFSLEVKKLGFFGKFSGLMFKSKETKNLLFEFHPTELCTIHSFFVFFPFLALWLDKNNRVLEWHFITPFTLAITPKKRPAKLVEIPLNKKTKTLIDLFVDKKETFKYIDE